MFDVRTSPWWIVIVVAGCNTAAVSDQPARRNAPAELAGEPARVAHERETAPERGPSPSPCAFESIEALCEGWRAHFGSYPGSWVSEGCARGGARRTSGPFAEVSLLGLRHGSGEHDGAWRERALLKGSVREPGTRELVTTEHLLVARVGAWWFPLHMYSAAHEGMSQPGEQLEWMLDDAGERLSWREERRSLPEGEPHGYGETSRTVLIVDGAQPMIAAEATVERWRSELDFECTAECARERPPPPHPECSQRCETIVRVTRAWEPSPDAVRIGATEVRFEGRARRASGAEERIEPETTRRLDVCNRPNECLTLCAFLPDRGETGDDQPIGF